MSDSFFSYKFRKAYQEKWKKSQQDFADAMVLRSNYKIKATNDSVSKWLNGKSGITEASKKLIIEILDLPEDYFELKDARDLYRFSSDRQDEIAERQYKKASDIGLSVNFLKAVRDLTSFDEVFPIYSYLTYGRTAPVNENSLSSFLFDLEYIRTPLAESAPMSTENEVLQIRKDGELHTLSSADLAFLKEVQDKVSEYVSFLFFEREREMKREEKEANNLAVRVTPEGWTAYSVLTEKQLRSIDRFRHLVINAPEECE